MVTFVARIQPGMDLVDRLVWVVIETEDGSRFYSQI